MKLVMYLGERVYWNEKTYQLFKDQKGNEYKYSGIKRIYFGEVVKLLPGDKMEVRPKTIDTEWKPTESEEKEYEAQKLVVRALRQEKLKAYKIKKPAANLTRAVKLFRPYYRLLNNIDRGRLISWFENECSKKGKK